MKRVAVICIVLFIICIFTGLSRTALDPEDFSGLWYTAEDQRAYSFQEGLIFCSKQYPGISGVESIRGAYWYCKDSVILFAKGIEGLETEKELYLIYNGDMSCLCENKDGSGKIYFIRYNE